MNSILYYFCHTMLLIYTPRLTNRIKYIFSVIFRDILAMDVSFTTDEASYRSYEGPRINYSKQYIEDSLFFEATDFLLERGIKGHELSFIDFEGIPALFPVYDKNSLMPFDPFAASFYLVARYEEYLPFASDEYGRFQARNSIAYQHDFLKKPVVNIWALKIYHLLREKYPSLPRIKKEYKFLPTIDVNAAYIYKCRGLVRSLGGYIKSIGEFNFREIIDRTRVMLGLSNDPIDTYMSQLKIHKKYELNTIYFILFADYGYNDMNISVNNRKFQVLIKSLADYCEVGIHISYSSIRDHELLKVELERLSRVLNKEITKARQHFLVLNMPMTYRNLVNLDISDDYSMGYVNLPGFRAGICDSFNFYDLDMDVKTNLRIHPFAVLDVPVSIDNKTLEDFREIIEEVKKVRGTLISLWNNESLTVDQDGKNGLQTYEALVKMAVNT